LQEQSQPHFSAKNALGDDFENEFADLADAREADDKGGDDFGADHRDGFDEFNPIFDSPATTKSSTVASTGSTIQPEGSFHGFEYNVGEATQGSNSGQIPQQAGAVSSHDWDAIFAELTRRKLKRVNQIFPEGGAWFLEVARKRGPQRPE
jgi:epidermal growth factor receptor substrate 15